MQTVSKFILLLNDGEGGEQPVSFRERKARELSAERNSEPPRQPQADLDDETPTSELESEQIDGDSHDLPGDEQLAVDDDTDEDLEDETPSDDDSDDDEQDTTDWEKRYKDTQAELTRMSESRKEESAEVVEALATATRLHHDLEDRLTSVEESAGFFGNGLNNRIAQMEQAFQQGAINPENMEAARAQYQGLINSRSQMQQHLERAKQAREEATEARKKREAEITRIRVRSLIPDWSREKYQQLGAHAQELGFSPDEYADLTDHRMFQLINDSLTLRSASKTVENVKHKRRPKPPRRQRSQRQRDPKGRFEKAKRDFRSNPGDKGAFRDMTAQRLARERKGR